MTGYNQGRGRGAPEPGSSAFNTGAFGRGSGRGTTTQPTSPIVSRTGNPFRGPPRGRGAPSQGTSGFGRGVGLGDPRSSGRNEPSIFAANQPAPVDSRLAPAAQDTLIATFKRLHLDGDFPHRPSWGNEGRPIKLRANFFPVEYPRVELYDYTVKLEPSVNIKRVRKRVYQLLEKAPEFEPFKDHVVHDSGGRLIASRKLPIPETGIIISIPFFDEDEEGASANSKIYHLTITPNNTLDTENLNSYLAGDPSYRNFDPLPIISALNIVIAQHPSRTGITVGRNRFFFSTPGSAQQLGSGLEAWKGYYSSVRPSFNQLMINVNVCTTAFYKPGNLAEAMIDFLKGGGGRLTGFVKGLRIETVHLGHRTKKSIKRLGDRTARQETFICEEYGNAQISVESYFRRKYGIVLRHGIDLPLVDVSSSRDRPVYLPAELCMISSNQPFRGKLTDDATAAMIRHACKPPNINAESIVSQGLPALGLQSAASLKEFGLTIGDKMAVIPGRLLTPPRITYSRGTVNVDDRAGWNLRDVQFVAPVSIRNWAVIVLKDNGRNDLTGADDPALRSILSGLIDVCTRSGMSVPRPQIAAVNLPPKDNRIDPLRKFAIEEIRNAINSILPKPEIVFVLLSNGDKHIYTGLKSLCDLTLDIHTVCCHTQKIRNPKGQLQFFANLALKFNAKLGGINHTVDRESLKWLREQPTMMFGSDVTHPSPGSLKGTPSIAAVVASMDDQFATYPASLRLQESRKEMITDLAGMVHDRLALYLRKNGKLPKRILFFRDGVSEGQFSTVTKEELPKIRQACSMFEKVRGPYRPKITLCIAGKRHHTRFYPTEAANADKGGNSRPGTVVDRGVTAIYDFDFFLQAHGGLQGTTRPTHYFVVHDENAFTADTIQNLTNSTSYMFARATRAVSLVPPAYYADLACERGRCYIHELLNANESGTSSGGNGATEDQVLRDAQLLWGQGVGAKLGESMFYL